MREEVPYKDRKGFNFEFKTEDERREHERRCKKTESLGGEDYKIRFTSTSEIGD